MIVFEHPLKMDKRSFTILMGILCWTCIALKANLPISDHTSIDQALQFHLGRTLENTYLFYWGYDHCRISRSA